MIRQDVDIFRYQPKRGVYGSVKAGQKSVYPLGVGVDIFCDLARNVFTIKQMNKQQQIKQRKLSTPSIGEEKVIKFLMANNIRFVREYWHKKLINPKTNRLLFIDFYLPDYRVAIEFDGVYHFKAVGSNSRLRYSKELDQIKNVFCWKNRIHLLRIKYTQNVDTEICKFFDRLGI